MRCMSGADERITEHSRSGMKKSGNVCQSDACDVTCDNTINTTYAIAEGLIKRRSLLSCYLDVFFQLCRSVLGQVRRVGVGLRIPAVDLEKIVHHDSGKSCSSFCRRKTCCSILQLKYFMKIDLCSKCYKSFLNEIQIYSK